MFLGFGLRVTMFWGLGLSFIKLLDLLSFRVTMFGGLGFRVTLVWGFGLECF